MSYILNVDNTEVKRFTSRLKEMHRSNFPIVVRQTLNDTAFDVKKTTLIPSVDKKFILRNPAFFRRYSGVNKATGWNVNAMKSEVGIIPGNSTAANQLTKQEYGGQISNRDMIYMDQARSSKSKLKSVRKINYLGGKGIVGGRAIKRSRKSNFIAAAYIAKKENKNVLWATKRGYTLYAVNNIDFSGSGRNRRVKVNAIPLADYESNRNVKVMAKPFLKPASLLSYNKQPYFYMKNAKARFEKALR
jgi:hypothetical protein